MGATLRWVTYLTAGLVAGVAVAQETVAPLGPLPTPLGPIRVQAEPPTPTPGPTPGGEQPGQPGQPAQPTQPQQHPGATDPDNLPRLRDNLVVMTFENADLSAVLRALSELWGKPIAASPELTGNITVLAPADVTVPESFEIMRSALNVRGFIMQGDLTDDTTVIRILPRKELVGRGGEVQVGRDPATVVQTENVITQVVPLHYVRAATVASALESLISKDNANIVAIDDTNTLIITDQAENVRRLLEVIAAIDDIPQERRELLVIPLENANAQDIQQLLVNIYSDPVGALARQLQGAGRQNPQAQQTIIQMLQAGAIDPTSGVRITADTRTNALVLYGPPEVLAQLEPVVRQLDRNITQQVIFRKFELRYADAASVAEDLNLLFPQPQGSAQATPIFFRRRGGGSDEGRAGFTSLKENLVVPDARTNSLLVTATPDNMRVFEELIRSMDQPTELHQVVEVIPLEFADARQVQQALTQLLRGSSGSRGFFFFLFGGQRNQDSPLERLREVTVVASQETNALIVTGPSESLPEVRRIIDSLDQPQAQVYISVIIADVTLSDAETLGVEMSWLKAPFSDSSATTDFDLDTNVPQGIRYALVSTEFQALLRALTDRNKVKVLSTPHITTLDNAPATISIGTQFPFPQTNESSGGTVQTSFDFKDIAIELEVVPRVSLGSQMVVLDVAQTIDELTGTIRQGNSEVPLIATRRADTRVMVESGQTIVIGGIIREREEKLQSGVPVLQDIPILGNLFRRTRTANERTELMVFLTPFVVTTDEQLQRIRLSRQKELAASFPQVEKYLEQQEMYREDRPPEPLAPAPEPQPLPAPTPVPEASLGRNGTQISVMLGPPTPREEEPRPLGPVRRLGPVAP